MRVLKHHASQVINYNHEDEVRVCSVIMWVAWLWRRQSLSTLSHVFICLFLFFFIFSLFFSFFKISASSTCISTLASWSKRLDILSNLIRDQCTQSYYFRHNSGHLPFLPQDQYWHSTHAPTTSMPIYNFYFVRASTEPINIFYCLSE